MKRRLVVIVSLAAAAAIASPLGAGPPPGGLDSLGPPGPTPADAVLADTVHADTVPEDAPPMLDLEPGEGMIFGLVRDRVTQDPVPGAVVRIENRDGEGGATQVASEDGTFRFPGVPVGEYDVHIDRFGYRELSFHAEAEDDRGLRLEVDLAPLAVELEGVVATVEGGTRLDRVGFHQRRESRPGHFFTRQELVDSRVGQLSRIFRGLPGFRVIPSARTGSGDVVSRRGGCRPDLYIDGALATTSRGLDDILTTEALEGLEVYAGAQTPPQFRGGRCGTIVAWTHTPGDDPEAQGNPFDWRRFTVAVTFITGALLAAF